MEYYYMFLPENLKIYNIKYHLGFNKNKDKINSYTHVIYSRYFSDKEHLMINDSLYMKTKIAKLYIPNKNKMVKVIDGEYRSGEIYIEEIHDLNKEETIKWMINEGIKINWNRIFVHLYNESFIEKYENKINWDNISCHHYLSDEFMEKYSDKINWENISKNQYLSKEFLIKHINQIDLSCLKYNQKITKELYKEIKNLKKIILKNKNDSKIKYNYKNLIFNKKNCCPKLNTNIKEEQIQNIEEDLEL